MQSNRRQIRRGHAVIAWDAVARRAEMVTRRGCPRVVWHWAVRNRMPETEADYCDVCDDSKFKIQRFND
jgi:hypothetical protein